jgi:hypothetical protein
MGGEGGGVKLFIHRERERDRERERERVLAFIRFFDNIFSLNSLNYEFLNGIIPS